MSNLLYDSLFGCHAGDDKPFLVFANGSQISYDAFLHMVSRFANTMKLAGLSAGDRLAVQVEKSAEALAIYAACVQSGVIFLPLNTAYKPAEVEYLRGDYSKAKKHLGWKPETSFKELVKLMVQHDIKLAEREKTLIENKLLSPTWEHST